MAHLRLEEIYLGVVEDNNDPERQNKCKVRVINIFDGLPTEDLPWASPFKDNNGVACSLPEVGKVVSIEFENGSIYTPIYRYSEHYNVNLSDKLKSLSDEDYLSMKALVFDHKTQVYTNEGEGLKLDHKFNLLNITDESIDIALKDNFGSVNIGTADATQQAILGNHFLDWFSTFVDHLLGSQGGPYLGNMLAPVIPHPGLISHLLQYKVMKDPKFLSHNVNLNDNGYVDKLDRINKSQEGDDWKSTTERNDVSTKSSPTDYDPKDGTKETTPSGAGADEEATTTPEEVTPEKIDPNEDVLILIQLLNNKGYKLFNESIQMNIIGVRYQYPGDEYSNKFSDKLYVFHLDKDDEWKIKNYKISTMPGTQIEIDETKYKKFKPGESTGGTPPDQKRIIYTYTSGYTFDNSGNASGIDVIVSNNVGLPSFTKQFSNVTFTIETATSEQKFSMDNIGAFEDQTDYPKSDTFADIVGTGEPAVSSPVVSKSSVMGKTISLKKYSQYIGNPGLGILQPAQYVNSYQLGYSPKTGEYKSQALLSKGKQVIWRDSDWDTNTIKYSFEEEGEFGYHIQRGFPGGQNVDNWSQGEQVFSSGKSLDSFVSLLKQQEQKHGNQFSYTLVTSLDYEEAQQQVQPMTKEEKEEMLKASVPVEEVEPTPDPVEENAIVPIHPNAIYEREGYGFYLLTEGPKNNIVVKDSTDKVVFTGDQSFTATIESLVIESELRIFPVAKYTA